MIFSDPTARGYDHGFEDGNEDIGTDRTVPQRMHEILIILVSVPPQKVSYPDIKAFAAANFLAL
jgi:hypothetical protein